MSPTSNPSRNGAVEEPLNTAHVLDNLAALYQKGVACVADIQNRSIDCGMQQNKATMELCKQLPWAPRVNVFDGFAGALDRFAEVQKAAIQLAVNQSQVLVELTRERAASASKSVDTFSKFAQQSFEHSVAAQKKAAEATVAGTKSAFENARERFAVPGSEAVVESIRHGVNTVIDAQKELLETASRRWTPEPETASVS